MGIAGRFDRDTKGPPARDSGGCLTGREKADQLGGCLVSLVQEGELKGGADLILPGHISQVCREKLN